jgi:hypothetical protein
MLMDTYQQCDEAIGDVGNDLDNFEARLGNPAQRRAVPKNPQFQKVAQPQPQQGPAKAPPPVVFRNKGGPSGPAIPEDIDANPDTRAQDVQDVRNLGDADDNSDDD